MTRDLPIVVLIGPTATGKSALAVDVALELQRRGQSAEIVNADSMLVYRGMDIGTAKPTMAERRGVVHHLIDVWDVTERASMARFQQEARAVIADIRQRGGVPLLVGGSALYTRAIIDVFKFPGRDVELRLSLERELRQVGPEAMHRRLAEIAPESAAKIEPGNGRRIVRALEVAQLTGEHEPELPKMNYGLHPVRQFGLDLDRDKLDYRIDQRVLEMFDAGLVDEVRHLLENGLRDGLTASRAIGYRQVIEMLDDNGTRDQAILDVQRATRRFSRKQMGWYRRDPRIEWLTAGATENVEVIAAAVESMKGHEEGSWIELDSSKGTEP